MISTRQKEMYEDKQEYTFMKPKSELIKTRGVGGNGQWRCLMVATETGQQLT